MRFYLASVEEARFLSPFSSAKGTRNAGISPLPGMTAAQRASHAAVTILGRARLPLQQLPCQTCLGASDLPLPRTALGGHRGPGRCTVPKGSLGNPCSRRLGGGSVKSMDWQHLACTPARSGNAPGAISEAVDGSSNGPGTFGICEKAWGPFGLRKCLGRRGKSGRSCCYAWWMEVGLRTC